MRKDLFHCHAAIEVSPIILASPVRGLKRWIAVHKRELRLHYPMHRIQHQRALARHVRVMATVLCDGGSALRTEECPRHAQKTLIVHAGGATLVAPPKRF